MTKKKVKSTYADVVRAKKAFDHHRAVNEAMGIECCLIVVGYVSGRDPFRLLGRVAADMAQEMPTPELTPSEMQSVAFAAKIAFAKVLAARKKKRD